MNQFHEDHNDEEGEIKTQGRGGGWWTVLPVVALAVLVYQIADAPSQPDPCYKICNPETSSESRQFWDSMRRLCVAYVRFLCC
jgi:hypothetical protein